MPCSSRGRLLAFLLVIGCIDTALAGDWPQYGGPDRTGVSRETGLLKQWPAEGPPLLWKITDLGAGFSPVSVAGTRVYTLAYRKDEEFVVALDRGTGKELWATTLGLAREAAGMNFLRQRQPLVDGDRLYAFSTHGHLVCLEADRGIELWRKRYREDFGGRSSPFGWTDYPLLDGDRLVCTPGGEEAFHVALDKRTGNVLWKSALAGFNPSHSPMVVAEVGDIRLYVQNLSPALVGISAKDGKLLWRYGKVSSGTANMATPQVCGDRVFVASGYRTGCALLKLTAKDGTVQADEVYFNRKDFENLYGGIAVVGDYVYGGNGPVFATADPTCFDWKSGKVLWRQKGPGQGAVATIAADGHIYFRFADGLMVLAEATPDGFKEKGQFRLPDKAKLPVWSVPVLAQGRLFLRDQQTLYCYDLRADVPRKIIPPIPPGNEPADKGRQADAVFVPSPPEVVEAMLGLAKVTKDDVVYDLGCGDGRILVQAAKQFGALGVGIELDANLVKQAREKAKNQGVQDRVTIQEADLFTADFRDATVVALYLLPHLNAKLRPQLDKLKPGTRIISHAFGLPGVEPDRVIRLPSPDGLREHTVYLWVTPLRSDRAPTANWPRFRGPNGTGLATHQDIPVAWTEKDVRWKTPLPGSGNASPIVWDTSIFVHTATPDGKARQLLHLNAADGKIVWSRSVPGEPRRVRIDNSLASGTPATDGARVYIPFWLGDELSLLAFDFQGNQVWRRDLGRFTSVHGACHSPIAFDGKIFFANDQDGSSVLHALDAATGKDVWQTQRDSSSRACYSTPIIRQPSGGKAELIVTSSAGVSGYEAATGKESWRYTWDFPRGPLRTIGSPLETGGLVVATSGDGGGDRLAVAIQPGGAGEMRKAAMVWEDRKSLPYIPSLLAWGDHLYFVTDQGIAGCYEARTGKRVWQERLPDSRFLASPVLIDGKVYAVSDAGEVFVFEAAPAFKLLAQNALGERVIASPAVAGGRLLIRGKDHLYCIGTIPKDQGR